MKDGPRDPVAGAAGPGDPEDAGRDRAVARRRNRLALVVAGFLVVTGVSVAGALGLGGGDGPDHGGGAPNRSSEVVHVTRATLTDQTEIDGQLGHGPQVPFPVRAKGTVTWLPSTGTTLRRGQAVMRADDRPVVLLYGSLPMYRDLGVVEPERSSATGTGAGAGAATDAGTGTGTGDGGSAGGKSPAGKAPSAPAASVTRPAADAAAPLHGMDVKQFESNLSALGYSGFTVDESYTELTANAVKRWQKDLGLPQTGRVGAGDVVYAPGPVRVAGIGARVGDEAAVGQVSYTSTARMVTVAAPAADTDWARRGSGVTVDLPDGRSVRGTVASLGSDASSASGGGGDGTGAGDGGAGDGGGTDGGSGGGAGGRSATVSVVITFDDQDSLGRLQSGPVTVRYTRKQRKDVLTVPVAALTALAEGGYGLELAGDGPRGGGDAGGPGRFVPVRTGLFAGGRVEVSGPGVREGMKVRIPK
ncbi:peptidoglycan-binding protein [Streptomyces sp. 1-11]|uniref:peptidoglycan-binding protein n=1 Tax=Streptomyces sp. 1-11 TaxID=2590549 RepID=UPI00117E5F96|nr:peptidoglycan-binding protein [Streptomyces sp. 1-11]